MPSLSEHDQNSLDLDFEPDKFESRSIEWEILPLNFINLNQLMSEYLASVRTESIKHFLSLCREKESGSFNLNADTASGPNPENNHQLDWDE
jgi:hypothetical protein